MDKSELLKKYKKYGYVIQEKIFNKNEILDMRKEANDILELIFNSSNEFKRRSKRFDLVSIDKNHFMVRKIQPINDLSLLFTKISKDERIIKPVSQFLMSEPELMEEKLNYKQILNANFKFDIGKKITDRFPIHNDYAYYKDQNYSKKTLTVAIAIDDCIPENGPLHIWPCSHKKHLNHEKTELGLQVKNGLIDNKVGIDLILPAGSMVFFSSLLLHSSRSNQTKKPRRMILFSYHPKSSDLFFDIRNRRVRYEESPYEMSFMKMKEKREVEEYLKFN